MRNGQTTYFSLLEAVVRDGQEMRVPVAGHSMTPFLVDGRDQITVYQAEPPFHRGDMVFYVRQNGQYVMHRVHHIKNGELYIVGDEGTEIEGPVSPDQVFGIVKQVIRKGKTLHPGNFCWWFFEKIWIRMVPLRPLAFRLYGLLTRMKG